MRGFLEAFLACLLAQVDDRVDLREALSEPAGVFPAFQTLVRRRLYGKAYECLAPDTRRHLAPEEFQIAFTAFEAPRRLILSAQVHAVDASALRLRLCNPEFGLSRDLKVGVLKLKHRFVYLLEFTPDDIEHWKDRTLGWFRHQVRRADGWHFAYPPDWSYAPVARVCGCAR